MSAPREILFGKNVVLEVLRAGRREVFKIFWARRTHDAKSEGLQKELQDREIPCFEVHPTEITNMTGSPDHQGIAAQVSAFTYSELSDVIPQAKQNPKGGFLVLLDEIQDPHNVGAIIRTSHLCGASGLVLFKHRQALITNAVCKAAAGAQEYLPVVKEVNLLNTIKLLKDNGFFIYGLSASSGQSLYRERFQFPIGLVLGSEGKGLRRLVSENCDRLLTIPMEGKIDSFNVSVAAAMMMGQILCQRTLSP